MQPSPLAGSAPGATFGGKYKIVRRLGEGGMGAVYEAQNQWTHRRVAVKVLRPEYTADADAAGRFMQEARSTAGIAHPNIVDVLDMGQEPSDGSLYIVQEYLDGLDLRDALTRSRRFNAADALAMLVPVMDALSAAHQHGVLHRDVKPENIFLTRGLDGEWIPKLIDFGISKMLGEDPAMRTRTRTGISVGTPDYMSPEQARGDSSVDARTDVWAIGAVLFELLAGRPPFDAPTANLVISRIITERAPLIESMVPGLGADLCALVNSALEPQRERRVETMALFRDAAMACECYPAELRSRRATARKAVPLAVLDDAANAPPEAPKALPAAPLAAGAAVSRAMEFSSMPVAPLAEPLPPDPPQPQRLVLVLTGALALTGIAVLIFALAWKRHPSSTAALSTVTSNAAPVADAAHLAPPPEPVAPVPAVAAPVAAVAEPQTPSVAPGRAAHPGSPLTVPHGRSTLPPIGRYSVH